MQIPCPVCQGTGILFKVTTPKLTAPNQKPTREKVVCHECHGDGVVEAGYLARKEGFIKDEKPT